MTDARLRWFWHRAGPLTAFAALLAAGQAGAGCSSSSGTGGAGGEGATTSSTTMSTTSSSSSSSSSSSGTGGSDGGTGMATLKTAADALSPLDATPDPMGTTIYFTAVDPVNGPGVFKVPADGSNTTPTAVKVGDPFAAPFGISTSSDGTQLYIADPGAVDPTSNVDIGLIFAMPAGGGTPVALAGSEQTRARALDVVKEGNADVIYFTGIDKTDGSPGIFKMPASGGSVSVVAKGSPFLDPSGIAVAGDGTIYVADTVAAGTSAATIVKIPKGGAAAVFFPELRVGYPAGVALSQDEKTLNVSALDAVTRTDQLLQIDVSNPATTNLITDMINTYTEAAGLHRAKNADIFAWADSTAGTAGGKVFTISFK